MTDKAPVGAERLRQLATSLGRTLRATRVARMAADRSEDDVATEAASSLIEIGSSARTLEDLVSALLSADPTAEEYDDILDDVAEELRHIYYHVTHARLFDYVVGDR